jgi:hypothetical protein
MVEARRKLMREGLVGYELEVEMCKQRIYSERIRKESLESFAPVFAELKAKAENERVSH